MNNRKLIFFIISGSILLVIAPFIGTKITNLGKIFSNPSLKFIFFQLRIPRTLIAFITGASLSLGGLIFQNLFRNRLATPFTLGISSGAAAGAIIAIKLSIFGSVLGFGLSFIFGISGAFLSVLLILLIMRMAGSRSIYTMLLGGIAINFFFSAFVLLFQYIVDMTQSLSALRWLMGNLSISGYSEVILVFPFFIIFAAGTFGLKKELLLISAGDEFALSKGLNTGKFRMILFIFVSIMMGIIVSVTGPIGFVGLIVPHMSRLLVKNRFNLLIFFSLFFGGIMLVAADILSRTLIFPAEIPVGIITSFFGAPFFIYILISETRKG